MLMTGLSWLTDELWRGHYKTDIQLPSYSYMFSIYTNNNKKLFHRGVQHQIYEEGHVIFDIMLLWILFHCRLRGSPLATKSRPSWNTATQAFWNTASKSWLFLGNLSNIIFCHMTWISISMLFFHFQGSQVLFTDTNVNRIFWCALTCYTNPQINKQSQQIFSCVISTFDVA